jgi:hypothetical protein
VGEDTTFFAESWLAFVGGGKTVFGLVLRIFLSRIGVDSGGELALGGNIKDPQRNPRPPPERRDSVPRRPRLTSCTAANLDPLAGWRANAVDGSGRREHFAFRHRLQAMDVNVISPMRIRIARGIAIGADLLQMFLFPLFSEGFISPLDDALDILVCMALTWLVGWHFSFLPSFIMKVVPVVDLAPTWTIAVFFATRKSKMTHEVPATQVYTERPLPPLLKLPPE